MPAPPVPAPPVPTLVPAPPVLAPVVATPPVPAPPVPTPFVTPVAVVLGPLPVADVVMVELADPVVVPAVAPPLPPVFLEGLLGLSSEHAGLAAAAASSTQPRADLNQVGDRMIAPFANQGCGVVAHSTTHVN